jgi:hypothetical protein
MKNYKLPTTDLGTLGVVMDADTNIANQWASVARVLNKHGCHNTPQFPCPHGTIVITRDGKKIGIWVMPDNQRNGALEDFVGSMIASGDDLWDKAQADVSSIPGNMRRFRPTYLSKAQVHTWLAWQVEPGTRMGETFKKKYLDPNCPQAKIFVNWIIQLLT